MKRRTVLAGIGTSVLALAGCVDGGAGTDQNSDAATSQPVDADRPHCQVDSESVTVEQTDGTQHYESVGTIPYPAVPQEFTEESTLSYVEAHEEAYVRHADLCSRENPARIIDFSYTVVESWAFEEDDVWTVALLYVGGAASGVDDDGYRWVTELGYSGVAYAITESGVSRASFDELPRLQEEESVAEKVPDPVENGELVVQF